MPTLVTHTDDPYVFAEDDMFISCTRIEKSPPDPIGSAGVSGFAGIVANYSPPG